MPFKFDAGDLDEGYFDTKVTPLEVKSCEVNDATHCKNCDLQGCRGCRGENLVLKDLKSIIKREHKKKSFSPLSPLTPHEQRFFDLTGHVPGDAWEGELPNDHFPDVGKMLTDLFDDVQACRSIPWPEVMAAADQERQWGRKSTLALMYPHHEGRFEFYEHPTTQRWHSYATPKV